MHTTDSIRLFFVDGAREPYLQFSPNVRTLNKVLAKMGKIRLHTVDRRTRVVLVVLMYTK